MINTGNYLLLIKIYWSEWCYCETFYRHFSTFT